MSRLVAIWLAFVAEIHAGIGSTFDVPERDAGNHGRLACTGRPMTRLDLGIASWWIPCNAKVIVCTPRTKQCAMTTVVDRGPGRSARRKPDDIDMTAALASQLGANGWEPVLWVELP